MLTLFTIPKSFQGHIGVIQRNAIQSWTLLRPACEIILFGGEEGTAEVARKLGLRHVSNVACNEYNTPLVNDLFEKAQQRLAAHDLICYVNTDIILMNDFMDAIKKIRKKHFLMVGQRWNIDLKDKIDFKNDEWQLRLRNHVIKNGKPLGEGGSDYFIFPKNLLTDIPSLAIGRSAWDNWLIYKARSLHVPVIDASKVILAVHQNHSYIKDLVQKPSGIWDGPEAKLNQELAGGQKHFFTLRDATWFLTKKGLKPAWAINHIIRQWNTLSILFPRTNIKVFFYKVFLYLFINFYFLISRFNPARKNSSTITE